MHFDTKHVETGPKMADIAKLCQTVRKLCESVWKYHQLIFQIQYKLFDAQHVEIGSKMAEIAKIVCNCVKIAWKCVKECVEVHENVTIEFLNSNTCILIPNILILAKKWLK